MLLIKILSISLLLLGCGRELVKYDYPENTITPQESDELNIALDDLQKDLKKAGATVDVRSVEYRVSRLDGNRIGLCYHERLPRLIVVDHSVMNDSRSDFPRRDYTPLYRTLLHEIGHCLFNRKHDDRWYEKEGHSFKIVYDEDRIEVDSSIQHSLMSSGLGWNYVPTKLWPFYVKEIVGKAKLKTWEDLKPYVDITLVEATPETQQD